jgi:hypothetical protein
LGPPGGGGQMRLQNAGKIPFDLVFFDDIFARVTPIPEDSALTAVIIAICVYNVVRKIRKEFGRSFL